MARRTKYAEHGAAFEGAQDRVMAVMREVGSATLDDLAGHLEVTEHYVRVQAEALVEGGKLAAIPGKVGVGGHKREYVLVCPECGGGPGDPRQAPEEGEEVGDLCTHPTHDVGEGRIS